MNQEKILEYLWPKDIYLVHLQLDNSVNKKFIVKVFHFFKNKNLKKVEKFIIGPKEHLRFNIGKKNNNHLGFKVVFDFYVGIKVFENLDRAYYSFDPVKLN